MGIRYCTGATTPAAPGRILAPVATTTTTAAAARAPNYPGRAASVTMAAAVTTAAAANAASPPRGPPRAPPRAPLARHHADAEADADTGERHGLQPRLTHGRAVRFGPPRRGFRYGYDSTGTAISFEVSRNANDFCDPADVEYRHRRAPSRSGSRSYRDGGDGGGLPKSYRSDSELPRRSYSTNTREPRPPRDYFEERPASGLGRRPSTGRRYNSSSRDEYYGGGGGSYDSMRSRYPPSDTYSRSYGGTPSGGGSGRRERSGGGGSSSLRPEAAYEEPKRRVVKPEDVDWEIETVLD
ncbi:hypothetical protein PG984_016360 [Apiospora sp. TS-2023a]